MFDVVCRCMLDDSKQMHDSNWMRQTPIDLLKRWNLFSSVSTTKWVEEIEIVSKHNAGVY